MNLILDGFLYTLGGIAAIWLAFAVLQMQEAYHEWDRKKRWTCPEPFLKIWLNLVF